ncbi:signal transduction histidine kinase [Brockia lithotrophica]|uniref:histidine kinase n=2 Tax=Brockia lithotrophica TaxID=933949 RepID=A0A660L522_9BACL|nr:signal transduction histidine kinase [Brockia lithotrophica]
MELLRDGVAFFGAAVFFWWGYRILLEALSPLGETKRGSGALVRFSVEVLSVAWVVVSFSTMSRWSFPSGAEYSLFLPYVVAMTTRRFPILLVSSLFPILYFFGSPVGEALVLGLVGAFSGYLGKGGGIDVRSPFRLDGLLLLAAAFFAYALVWLGGRVGPLRDVFSVRPPSPLPLWMGFALVVFAAAWLFDVHAERLHVFPSRESARERRPFVAVFAHELKNSLAVLRGYLQLNARAMPAAQQKLLLSEVDRAQLLAEELLDLYVPKPLQRKDVDPVTLLTEVHELMRPYANQAEVYLALRYQSFHEKACALDARRVHQALVNVIKNAIEVSPPGGTVTLELRKEGEYVVFSVADEGPGIPEPQRAHVFDPFWSNKAGGTGIGLFLTHRIVVAHGGKIEIEERNPHGTIFRLVFPCRAHTALESEAFDAYGRETPEDLSF